VYERKQFSWTATKKAIHAPDPVAINAAYIAITQHQDLNNFKAIYYHSNRVRPIWSRYVKYSTTIRNHIFYEENV
jgi:spore germination cell wall hydrolase CwlJ-like protein